MGFRGPKVQILSSRPVKTGAYGENREPFFCEKNARYQFRYQL